MVANADQGQGLPSCLLQAFHTTFCQPLYRYLRQFIADGALGKHVATVGIVPHHIDKDKNRDHFRDHVNTIVVGRSFQSKCRCYEYACV